ncbi:MAG: sulfatase-like hydrolase/transferase [Planctomycetaceae bacterium]|nr:sulfatase-like hydrolase/transferase [Planctomycetaceae bacterium]
MQRLVIVLSGLAMMSFQWSKPLVQAADSKTGRPNIVYVMSDELAYFEVSHMGNPLIRTPRIDAMAKDGIRLTQALAGSPVCAPLRCTLMTGKHAGHASVRANDGGTPLRADEPTIASMLKKLGYATGGFGKWGCGGRDSTGVPEKHGFDVFYGYYDQVHAHTFYPPYLIRNSEEVPLEGNDGGRSGQTYSHYKIMDEAEAFIRQNKDQPFFCYLPITPPHGNYDIPADDPAWDQYRNDEWIKDPKIDQDAKNYAAMVTMVDNNLGRVLDLLKELKLEDNTIVFFTGDNGGQDRFKNQQYVRGFHKPNVNPVTGVEFRGGKGNLYEGGLRIPFLVRWPGKIGAGQVSDRLCYQPDMLATLAELTGADAPPNDGTSILPTLLGADAVGHAQQPHEFLYWEFGNQTAVRIGQWKGIQPKQNADWELYDLTKDLSEAHDVAAEHPEIVKQMKAFAEQSHEDVRPGEYLDPERTRHQRDRQAKFGFKNPSNQPKPRRGRKNAGMIKEPGLIPFEQLRLHSFSSENPGNDKFAQYAIDGDPDTLWHTQFSPQLQKHPHELVIDLGKVQRVSGLRYVARQDNGWNGTFGKTEVRLAATAEGLREAHVAASATITKAKDVQSIDLDSPTEARYVQVRVLSEVNNGPWASAADIGVVAATGDQ